MNNNEYRGRPNFFLMAALGIAGICLLLYLPLFLSLIEYTAFGKSYTEELFMAVGLHDEMAVLYQPVIDLLGP